MAIAMSLRLLAAARHAYAITGDGAVAHYGSGPDRKGASPPASACVGYTTTPVGVLTGEDHEHAGFVATIPEGIVVSIRGTTPPDSFLKSPLQVITDWATDTLALMVGAIGDPPGFPGKVHMGFYKGFMRLWDELGPRVKATVQANPGLTTLYVTGHSKGGAICPLVAWRLRLDHPNHHVVVRSFAPARVGDAVFAQAYNKAVPDHVRYEFDNDIVPHLPLEPAVIDALGAPKLISLTLKLAELNYGAVGRLAYILEDGSLVPQGPGLDATRLQRLVARLATIDGPKAVIDCHGLESTQRGYAAAHFPLP